MVAEVKQRIVSQFLEAEAVMRRMTESHHLIETIEIISLAVYDAMASGGKLLLAGNGGSAADAQHIAAEFVNYFGYNRPALPAIALTTDSSVMTSISNDSDYTNVFARQLHALGRPGDIFFGYTTSGTSKNIVEALKAAKELGILAVALTGESSKELDLVCDHIINVPSGSTPKIQEGHLVIGHTISGLVEDMFFGSNAASGR
jgi:D-sedoheptulose 7-phosphate isomerase